MENNNARNEIKNATLIDTAIALPSLCSAQVSPSPISWDLTAATTLPTSQLSSAVQPPPGSRLSARFLLVLVALVRQLWLLGI